MTYGRIVCYLTTSGSIGGVDAYILSNAPQVSRSFRIWVMVGFTDSIAYYASNPYIEKVLFCPFTRAASPRLILGLIRLLRHSDIALFHSNDLLTSLWGKLFSFVSGSGCGHITTIHSVLTEHEVFSGAKRFIVFGLLRLAATWRQSKVVAVSGAVAGSIPAVGIRNRDIVVMHHGIDYPDTRELRRPRQADAPVRVGFVGRLTPEKGPDIFFRCVQGLDDRFEVHVYGTGSPSEYSESASPTHVVFHGFVSDRREIYGNLDVVCITSRTESFSYVLFEAVSAGCRVLALKLPVFDELLGESVLSETILCADENEMRRRILDVAETRHERDESAVDELLARFSIEAASTKLMALYREVCG